jgi:signal-transduction protein with cAMP-binding, CBS, and nucleotidyltransferase domain
MSIKLTDEQLREIDNIFDVQGIGIPENLIKATANMAFELLTEEQIKHLAESKGMHSSDELKAHCEKLRNCLMKASAMDPDRIGFERCLGKTLASTPQQSLAKIKAQAIEEAINEIGFIECAGKIPAIDLFDLREYVNQLREQAK